MKYEGFQLNSYSNFKELYVLRQKVSQRGGGKQNIFSKVSYFI